MRLEWILQTCRLLGRMMLVTAQPNCMANLGALQHCKLIDKAIRASCLRRAHEGCQVGKQKHRSSWSPHFTDAAENIGLPSLRHFHCLVSPALPLLGSWRPAVIQGGSSGFSIWDLILANGCCCLIYIYICLFVLLVSCVFNNKAKYSCLYQPYKI